MADFAEAVSAMIGKQEIDGEDIVYTTGDVVDIINAAIQLMGSDDKEDAVKKMQELRAGVEDKCYSLDALKRWTDCDIENEDDVPNEKLYGTRLVRFQRMYPVAYLEFDRGRNRTYVMKCVNQFCREFPTPIKSSIVYNDAKNLAAFWNSYVNYWETSGLKNGSAIAWAVDSGRTLHLLHFFNNMMDIGVILSSDVIDEIIKMREQGTYAADAYDLNGNRIGLNRNSDSYAIYVNNELIMEIKPGMFMAMADNLKFNIATSINSLRPFLNDLVHG